MMGAPRTSVEIKLEAELKDAEDERKWMSALGKARFYEAMQRTTSMTGPESQRIAEQPTFELRLLCPNILGVEPRLQQKWLVTVRDAAGSYDTRPEWRDVPVVLE